MKRDPRTQESKSPRTVKLLAGAHQPVEGVPVSPEPEEDQGPPPAVPVEDRNAQATARRPPRRSREHQIELVPPGRDFLLVPEEVLGLALAEAGVLLLRPSPHLLAGDAAFATLEERDKLEVRRGQGLVRNVLDELPVLPCHVAKEGGFAVRRERLVEHSPKRFLVPNPALGDARLEVVR